MNSLSSFPEASSGDVALDNGGVKKPQIKVDGKLIIYDCVAGTDNV